MQADNDETLPYRVGGLLYIPAFKEGVARHIGRGDYSCLTSVAFCLEDSVMDGAVETAERNLVSTLAELREWQNRGSRLPMIFIRIRSVSHLAEALVRYKDFFGIVTGFILPKFGVENAAKYAELIAELQTLPDKIKKVLDDKERIQWFAAKFANARDIFFIGRGLDYAISMEGSLKMKEISYIHSEAYAAGELKHGTISLVEDGTLVIGVLTQQKLFEKMISNMVEVKSRGAYLMGLTSYGNYSIEDTVDFTVYIPKTDEHFATSLAVVPLQLMGYYVSVAKGLDVDKPRNLAKSVTVE